MANKNWRDDMKKEIEKYICYYLLVYIIVLVTYASFDYFISCNGKSLDCKVDWSNVKDILQTTASILTPIVAIVGFFSWKQHEIYRESQEVIKNIHKEIQDLFNIWINLRNEKYFSFSLNYLSNIPTSEIQIPNKYDEVSFKIHEMKDKLNNISNLIYTLYFNKKFDSTGIDNSLEDLKKIINDYKDNFIKFRNNMRDLSCLKKYRDSDIEFRKQVDYLSSKCNKDLQRKDEHVYIDHEEIMTKKYEEFLKDLKKIKDNL